VPTFSFKAGIHVFKIFLVALRSYFLEIRIFSPGVQHCALQFLQRMWMVHVCHTRHSDILGVCSPGRPHYVWWRLIFVGPEYGACFISFALLVRTISKWLLAFGKSVRLCAIPFLGHDWCWYQVSRSGDVVCILSTVTVKFAMWAIALSCMN
jgi:hypothetical protein